MLGARAGTGSSAGSDLRVRRGKVVAAASLVVALVAVSSMVTAALRGAWASTPVPPQADAGPTRAAVTASGPWSPDEVGLPPDLPGRPLSPCALQPRPEGWLRVENDQPGTPGFVIPENVGSAREVLGYADRVSAVCGDIVNVSLAGPTSRVRLDVYRIGGYRGSPGRRVWSSPVLTVRPGHRPAPVPGTHLIEPRWPVSAAVLVTPEWLPGVYLLVPTAVSPASPDVSSAVADAAACPVGPGIPLVVRDDVGHEPVLFVASTMTWHAYNNWHGYSLYRGPGSTVAARYASRARVVSFRRPLVGGGYDQLTFMDLPVVVAIERSGLDTAYTTDVDVDQRPSQLVQHAELVFGGHSEYWTRRAYDAVAAVRGSGTNLLFLGANNLWWHARLERGPGVLVPDRLVVYREIKGDPTPSTQLSDFTLLWSAWPEHRDPATMLAGSHAAIAVHGGYQVYAAPAWMLAGTGLRAASGNRLGSVLPGAVGNEADGYNPAAHNPPGVDVVAVGVLRGARGPVLVSASYFVASSGAATFVAGSTDWACALQGSCFDQSIPAATAVALGGWTRNLLMAFAVPRAGLSRPAEASVPPLPAELAGRLDPRAVGRYGGSESSEENSTRSRAVTPPTASVFTGAAF
jgi:hypothetical protein